jgi:hypothetical protein
LVVLVFAIVENQLQYADGIDSSSTICINGKCVTKVCPENEPCRTIGDNSTSSSKDDSIRDRDNITSTIPDVTHDLGRATKAEIFNSKVMEFLARI